MRFTAFVLGTFLACAIAPAAVLQFTKVFGGSRQDFPAAIASDQVGNIYIAGNTQSFDFPTKNALQPRLNATPLISSQDDGKMWSVLPINEPVFALAASGQHVYAGAEAAFLASADGGRTLSRITPGPLSANQIVVDPRNPMHVYVAGAGGIQHSEDGGQSWTTSNSGIDFGPFDPLVWNIGIHPRQPDVLYALATSLYLSEDGGGHWRDLQPVDVQQFQSIIAFALDPADSNVVYAVSSSRAVLRSTDRGTTWNQISGLTLVRSTDALYVSRVDSNILFALTPDGLARSIDSGSTWQVVAMQGLTLQAFTFDPENPTHVYAGALQAVFESTDNGLTWSALPATVRRNIDSMLVNGGNLLLAIDPAQDIFVTKWSPSGDLIYSTYLGGSGSDSVAAIAVDQHGSVYLAGSTESTDFPLTPATLRPRVQGTLTAFVAKLSPDGSRLEYSALLGGSSVDYARAVAVDVAGSAYVCGFTNSVDFPTTLGAYQTQFNPAPGPGPAQPVGDPFIAKLDPVGQSLVYSTFLGGSRNQVISSVAVDASGAAVVGGSTNSYDFPVTPGAAVTDMTGTPQNMGFVTKLNPQGSSLIASTLIDGQYTSTTRVVNLDQSGNIYAAGTSKDSGIVVRPDFTSFESCDSFSFGALGFVPNTGGPMFVRSFDPNLSKAQTNFVLGRCGTVPQSIGFDSKGHLWLSGLNAPFPSISSPFPLNTPLQAMHLGEGFLTNVDPSGEVLFSTLTDNEGSLALAADGSVSLVYYTPGGPSKALSLGFVMPTSIAWMKLDLTKNYPIAVQEPQKLRVGNALTFPYDPTFGIAPGEIITLDALPLPATSQVFFDEYPGQILSKDDKRLECFVPAGIAGRATTTIQVTAARNASNPMRVPVLRTAPQILALANSDGSANDRTHPADPGGVVTLYVTGLGNPSALPDLTYYAANNPLVVLYSGLAPEQPVGVFQVNLQVPIDIPEGQHLLIMGLDAESGDQVYLWIR